MSGRRADGSEMDLRGNYTVHDGPLTTVVAKRLPDSPEPCFEPPVTDAHGGLLGCVVLKITPAPMSGKCLRRKPHNARQEVVLLRRCRGDRVVALLAYDFLDTSVHVLTLPLLAFSLRTFLDRSPARTDWPAFVSVAKDTLSALRHIHAQGVAHRDICPGNLMFDWARRIKLVDFGISWDTRQPGFLESEGLEEHGRPEWTEPSDDMCCDVGTGPYRAPELLFGPKTYDAEAIDLWAAGATLAEFVTPLRPKPPPTAHDPLAAQPTEHGGREALFDASRGDLGLIGSIWSIRGTPTPATWPEFDELPNAGMLHFEPREQQDLASLLPGLAVLEPEKTLLALPLLDGLLQLSPARRLSPERALALPLFH